MENVRIYSNHVAGKESTEYALFFIHEGKSGRFDMDISDHAGITEAEVVTLMFAYIDAELTYPDTVEALADLTSVKDRNERADIWSAERGLERREELES